MLTKQSTIEEIETHIQQMSILLMAQKELETIEKLMFLEDLLKDEGIQRMIRTELEDDTWDYDTQVLINSCKRKKLKADLTKEHISKCYDFLILRHLEERTIKYAKVIAERHETARETKWIFTCIPRQDDLDPVRWANAKFLQAVENSSIKTIFEKCMDERDNVTMNENWVMENRDKLYNEEIFSDMNQLLEKKMRENFGEKASVSGKKNEDFQVENPAINSEEKIPSGDNSVEEIDLFC